MAPGHAQALEQLLSLLSSLEETLQREADALTQGDLEALSAHTVAKQALLRQLQSCMSPASSSFEGHDVPELLARLHRCHALNQATGAAISTAMRHNAQLLSMLGQDSTPVAYGRSNASAAGIAHTGRSLATA